MTCSHSNSCETPPVENVWETPQIARKKNNNNLMCMDDIKLFVKTEKELETLIQVVRIYSEDVGMEFVIEKCVMMIMKGRKRQMMEGVELPNQ